MLRILLVDDEPLVLIGLQGMLEWEKLGYTVCGTARNGKLALELIEREKPDIVIADVKMPVMDGLTLARTCRERSALPAFIMLTSFEEFGYIKQAMGAGVVDYLVKLDLTPENLQTALAKAAEKVKKERALLGELSAQENLAESVRSYQERFFVRLYAGLFPDEAALEQPLQHMELNLASDAYLVASCEIIANTALTPAQQLKLSFSCGRMLETTLQNYLPCYVTGADAMRCNVLFCLTDAQCQNYRTVLRPLLERASQILYNYFTVRLLWAVGRPTGSLLGLARCCRENAHLQPLLTVEQPIQFVEVNEGDATAGKMQVVAQVQEYIQSHLSERLTLADVAAVFNFSPNYLSQLFGKYGDSGFVEYITETRIAAAKEMLEQGDLKYTRSLRNWGTRALSIFPRCSKRSRGSARGNTSKVFKTGGFYDTGTACFFAGISFRLPALPPAKERTAWQGLPLRAKQRFLQAGEAALQTPIAPLPLSLWLDFTHTGGAPHGRRLTSPAGRGCARW